MSSLKKVFTALFILTILFFAASLSKAQVKTDTSAFDIGNPEDFIPQKYTILGIDVVGAQTTNEDFIPSTSGLEEGMEITIPGEEISDAIKRLYRTGLYEDVEIRQTQQMGSGIFLEIIVLEQPRLNKFEIEGGKKSQRKDLREEINLLKGFAVTQAGKDQARKTINNYYKKKGYWETDVEIYRSKFDTSANKVNLTIQVEPGERYEVQRINISGNENFKDKQVEKLLKPLKRDKWYKFIAKQEFIKEDFQEGKQKVVDFYRENGHRDFRIISDSVYLFDRGSGKKGVTVDLELYEGPQYKVRNVNWEGNTVYTDEQLTASLGFTKGEVFNEKKFEENLRFNQDNSDVTSLYQNIGYLFFQVQPDIKNVGRDSLDLNFFIFEDEVATINQVSFDGNTKTHDDVVRRSIRTIPGNKFSRQLVIRTIRELGQLGYFIPEEITPDLNPNPNNKTVDIKYNLNESASTDNFEFSGGFGGQGVGVILSARLNFTNFSIQNVFNGSSWSPLPSGDGQRLSLGVQLTGRGFQSYSFSFQEPWFRGKPNSLGLAFSYSTLNLRRSDITNNQLQANISLGKRLKWPDDFFTLRTILGFQKSEATGSQIFFTGQNTILTITEQLERNSLDNPISPTSGSKLILSAELGTPIAKFDQFYKLKTTYQNHVPIIGKLVGSTSIEYGYIGFLGQDNRNNFNRFFLGGTAIQQRQAFINDNIDLRGFPGGTGRGAISPIRNNQAVGGRVFAKYTAELRYPLINSEQLRMIPYVFYDAGNAFLNLERFDPFNMKRAVGPGVRLFLPILGMIDISLGRRLDSLAPGSGVDSGEFEFLFNIGAPF